MIRQQYCWAKWCIIPYLVLMFFFLTPSVISAHAEIEDSIPENAEQVASAPSQVTLRYSEGVQISTVTVWDKSGQLVNGNAAIDTNDSTIVHVPLNPLADGTYTVQWETLSVDGHVVSGSYFFVVGEAVPNRETFLGLLASNESQSHVNPVEPFLRGLLFLTFVLLVGLPATMLSAVYPVLHNEEERTTSATSLLRRIFAGSMILMILVSVVLVVSQLWVAYETPSQVDISLFTQMILALDAGLIAAIRTVVGIAFLVGLFSVVRPRLWNWCALMIGSLTLFSISIESHSGIMLPLYGLVSDFAHLMGAMLWTGGLLTLVIVLPRIIPPGGAEDVRDLAVNVIRRFSIIAILSVAFIVVSGSLLASYHIPTWAALVSTLYGLSLVAKVVVFIAAVGLGTFHHFVMRRQLQETAEPVPYIARFVRSVGVEIGTIVLVFFLAGLLTSAPTANVAIDSTTPDDVLTSTAQTENADIQVDVLPVWTGLNLFDIQLRQDGQPIPREAIENLYITLHNDQSEADSSPIPLAFVEPGLYSAVTSLDRIGDWQIGVEGIINGQLATHMFDISLVSIMDMHDEESDEDDYFTPSTPFQQTMINTALVVALLTVVVLAYQLLNHRRTQQVLPSRSQDSTV